jgi:uncharacterized protein (TIGR00255 family)
MTANSPLRSMTGYGDAEADFDGGRIRVEVRTVNHRYLNVQLRMPTGLERHQVELERVVKAHLARGHVSVSLTVERGTPGELPPPVEVDLEKARGYLEGFRKIQDELGAEGTVDLSLLAGFRDLFQLSDRDRTAPEVDPAILREALEVALRKVVSMRVEEGVRLAEDLSSRLTMMEAELAAIAARAPERLVAERDRLRLAISELLDDAAEVDEERIAREIAYLAERWDIQEELVRFRSHLQMFRDALENGHPDGVGKRFGFISQELLRETNTLGSKANDAQIARSVVALKEEIERLREQIENVE